MKAALFTCIVAVLLISAGGVIAARDQIQGAHLQCNLGIGNRGKATNRPEILSVSAGGSATAPVIELGHPVCITVQGLGPTGSGTPDVELALFIAGHETPARTMAANIPDAQSIEFDLKSAADAKSDDGIRIRSLLGGLLAGASRKVTIGVGAPGASQLLAATPEGYNVELKVYSPRAAATAGAGFILLLVAIYLAGRTTSLLRDGDANSTYSLGRVQMAFWMIATVFGFAFIWVLTHQYINVITASTFTLVGIAGATAIASRAIDDNHLPQASKGFIADIISDANGPQLHRIQIAIWTLVLGTIFIWNILDLLMLTDFDSNLLILVGIANGVYAGFKTQESSTPAPPSPQPTDDSAAAANQIGQP